MTTENKNNIIFENGCSKCEAVYFGESKRLLKVSIVIKMNLRNTVGKRITTVAGIKRKLLKGKFTRLIPRKIKEAIHSLKNLNHINKISYMVPEIWLPRVYGSS